jgi:putative methyltransferase (TIGR04325 family)
MSNIEVAELKLVRNWQEAVSKSRSYVDSNLVESLTQQLQNDLVNRSSPISREMETVRKSHLLLGWSFSCIGITNPKIADIGGGNGYMFDWIKSAYPLVNPNWIVFESKEIAEAYQMYSAGLGISFASSTPLDKTLHFDLTIISCTLQYLDNWEDVLEAAFIASKYVLLMRMPLIHSNQHKVYVQTPGHGLYVDTSASWPIRLFSRKDFMLNLERMSEVVFSTYDPEETFPFEGGIFPLETFLLKSKLNT